MDLGFPKTRFITLREQFLRTTLRNVRSQGHPCVELRRKETADGNMLIFYCIMCLKKCYGLLHLLKHLTLDDLHTKRLANAQVTLLKPNPWPFNDGVLFFHSDSEEQSKSLPPSDCEQNKLLDTHHADADCLALVGPVSSAQSSHQSVDNADCDEIPSNSSLDGDGTGRLLVIPGVLRKDEVSDLVVRHIGVGKIGARFCEKDGVSSEILRIWCEWLGNVDFTSEDINVIPEHEFAIVTFSCNYNLGRKGLFDVRYLLPSSPHSESVDTGCSEDEERKIFSDIEDTSEALRTQGGSAGEEFQSSNNSKSKVLSGNDDQLVHSRVLSSKTMRNLLRKQERVACKRTCNICQQKMRPNKDVAALMNRKTRKLVCSSRNLNGAFHLFHISCLIHWILLCEVETFEKQSVEAKVKPRCRKRVKGNNGQKQEVQDKEICSVLCPDCQGTGITIDGDDLEKPTVSLSEIYLSKIKRIDAYNEWIKTPELLENCSTGFCFPLESVETYQENVSPLKLLYFYRADD